VRGLIAILLRLYSARTPQDILAFDAKAGFESLGLAGALSTQRSNGLFSMVERIRRDAAAG
jgi:cysteine desulfuration protein SufE